MVSYTLRMSEPIKNQLDEFCDKMGMNLTTFFMLYIKKTLRDQKIPFELGLEPAVKRDLSIFEKLREQAKKNGLQSMTLSDINAEIAATRMARL